MPASYYKVNAMSRQRLLEQNRNLLAEHNAEAAVIRHGQEEERAERKDTHNRGRAGKRADLNGLYVRSVWEANYARYLNFLINKFADSDLPGRLVRWEYEPEEFEFPYKRGNRFYTPDFKLILGDGTYRWREVKGWMTADSKIKLKRFEKHYPVEFALLEIVGKAEMQEITMRWSKLIEGWE